MFEDSASGVKGHSSDFVKIFKQWFWDTVRVINDLFLYTFQKCKDSVTSSFQSLKSKGSDWPAAKRQSLNLLPILVTNCLTTNFNCLKKNNFKYLQVTYETLNDRNAKKLSKWVGSFKRKSNFNYNAKTKYCTLKQPRIEIYFSLMNLSKIKLH